MIFQAGLITFMRTILIFVGVYYAFKIIVRFLFPWIVKRFLNKQFSSFNQQNDPSAARGNNEEAPSKEKNRKKESLGEYVDYEEIKDEK